MKKIIVVILNRVAKKLVQIAGKINYSSVSVISSEERIFKVALGDGLIYELHRGEYVDDQIYKYGCFEPYSTKIVRAVIRPGMTIVDVGANFGYYSCLCSKLTGETGKVYAFEPTKFFRERLERNKSFNNADNISISPMALSDAVGYADIKIEGDTATLHWVPKDGDAVQSETSLERINTTTLDDFCIHNNLTIIDFIKVDIDGHEMHFLKGAKQQILQNRPLILMEVSPIHLEEAGNNLRELWDFIEELDYRVKHEIDLQLISNYHEFLYRCGNFSASVNVLLEPKR